MTHPEPMKEIANSPVALPGVSDGGAHTKFVTTGRYATELLGYWVREHEIMSLEEAHWRLSAYPAMAVGLKDRGFLAEGKPADVIVYDPDTVDSLAAGAAVRLPGRRMAARPEGDRLRPDHRQRRDDVHRRRVHRRHARQAAPPRHGLRRDAMTNGNEVDHDDLRRRQPLLGDRATPSPATATRSSPTGAST